MSSDDEMILVGLIVGLLIGFAACCITHAFTSGAAELRAVRAGVAEYYLDAGFTRQFRFITITNGDKQ